MDPMDSSFRRNTLILVASLAAILFLYFVVYWLPQRRHTARILGEIHRKQTEIERFRQQSSLLATMHGELGQLETYNRQATERLPPTLNVREFLAAVHSLGQQDSVTLSNVTPGIASEWAGVQQQSISLILVGKFHAMAKLMYQLETMPRLVELIDLDIRSLGKPGREDDAVEVKLNVRLFARPSKIPSSS